jgi:hypothetical protein
MVKIPVQSSRFKGYNSTFNVECSTFKKILVHGSQSWFKVLSEGGVAVIFKP